MRDQDVIDKIQGLCHAIQSGVSMELNYDPTSATPKHLRTGVNLAMVYDAATVSLLIEKGVFTLEEYNASLVKQLELEKQRYEARLSHRLGGTPITLA